MRTCQVLAGPAVAPTHLHRVIGKSQRSSARSIAPLRVQAAAESNGADATTKEYLSWAQTAGILFPKVTQAFFGDLRGTKALEPIEAGEMFVTVPRSAALVVEPTSRCPVPDFCSASFWKQAPWFIKMAVLVLRESSRGKDSPVWGYILQLPESIDTAVRWDDAELAELQYEPLENDIRAQRNTWREQYDLLKKESAGLGGEGVTWERFLWAAENVRSRAFSGPYAGAPLGERLRVGGAIAAAGLAYVTFAHVPLEQALNGAVAAAVFNLLYDVVLSSKLKWYALCPVIDAINHSSNVESTIEYEYFKDNFVASTDASYAPGSQVFISYGKQPNSALFQYYGFTEVGNKNDVYALNAVVGGQRVRVIVGAAGNLTPVSLKAVREAAGGDEAAARAAVLGALEAELAGKPTTLADDERQLATPHLLTPRRRAALEFRADKKRLLQRAIGKAGKKAAAAAGAS